MPPALRLPLPCAARIVDGDAGMLQSSRKVRTPSSRAARARLVELADRVTLSARSIPRSITRLAKSALTRIELLDLAVDGGVSLPSRRGPDRGHLRLDLAPLVGREQVAVRVELLLGGLDDPLRLDPVVDQQPRHARPPPRAR